MTSFDPLIRDSVVSNVQSCQKIESISLVVDCRSARSTSLFVRLEGSVQSLVSKRQAEGEYHQMLLLVPYFQVQVFAFDQLGIASTGRHISIKDEEWNSPRPNLVDLEGDIFAHFIYFH